MAHGRTDNGAGGQTRVVVSDRITDMLFLGRILLVIAIIAGLGYAALYAIVTLVEPEPRDIVITIPTPRNAPKNTPVNPPAPLPKS